MLRSGQARGTGATVTEVPVRRQARVERLSVRSTPDQKRRYLAAAASDGIPLAEWMRRAIDAYLERYTFTEDQVSGDRYDSE